MISATSLLVRLRLAKLAMRLGQWLAEVVAPEFLDPDPVSFRCPCCSATIVLGGAS